MWIGLRTLVIDAAATYAIAYYVQGPYMPWIGFIFLMGRMSVNHITRQLDNNPTAIDITGAQMVNIMKLSAFCWNVFDGRYPDSELTDSQKERAIRELPSLLDYAGYVLFFPGLLVGPAFDYVDYQSYITTTMFNLPPGTDPSKAPPTRKKRRIPRSGRYAAWKAATGLAWVLVFLQLSNFYYRDYYLTDEYMKFGFFRRVFQLYMLGVTQRTKYYGVWALSEGACILAGIGYRGIDPVTGKPAWDRLSNVQPFKIELAQNVHDYIGYWNINTNHWLRNYVYLRVTPKGKKPGFRASLATFVTSAFWHGFYPGYYLTFVLASFFQTIAKCKCYKAIVLYFANQSNNCSQRRPPPASALLPARRRQDSDAKQTILRYIHVVCDANGLRFRRVSVHHPRLPIVHQGLGPRLLLRHHRHGCVLWLLAESRPGMAAGTGEGEDGCGQARHATGQECRADANVGYAG